MGCKLIYFVFVILLIFPERDSISYDDVSERGDSRNLISVALLNGNVNKVYDWPPAVLKEGFAVGLGRESIRSKRKNEWPGVLPWARYGNNSYRRGNSLRKKRRNVIPGNGLTDIDPQLFIGRHKVYARNLQDRRSWPYCLY